jgi:hypothetical protein
VSVPLKRREAKAEIKKVAQVLKIAKRASSPVKETKSTPKSASKSKSP